MSLEWTLLLLAAISLLAGFLLDHWSAALAAPALLVAGYVTGRADADFWGQVGVVRNLMLQYDEVSVSVACSGLAAMLMVPVAAFGSSLRGS